jgi:hypothetical protein
VYKRLHGVGQLFGNSKSTGKLYLLRTKNERLLFHHAGDQHFLSQVWFSGDEDERKLIPGVQAKSPGRRRSLSDQAIVV